MKRICTTELNKTIKTKPKTYNTSTYICDKTKTIPNYQNLIHFSALEVNSNVIYKFTFYILTYLLTFTLRLIIII